MEQIVKNWNVMRVFRLMLGVFILGDGIRNHEPMFIFLGILFSILPIFNIGCGLNGGTCAPAVSTKKGVEKLEEIEEITYTEIK